MPAPSTLPGSFASAAAGNSGETSTRTFSRPESGAFADWARRSNGATQTFRRSSTTNVHSSQMHQRDSASSSTPAGAYVPPHMSAGRNGSALDTRYSKIQLLDLFRAQRDAGELDDDFSDLSVGETLSSLSNGISTPKWVRRDENKIDYNVSGPEICWERSAVTEPLGLIEMTEEEKELFTSSVNSPLKGPNQVTVREGGSREVASNRKPSFSHASASGAHAFGLASPTSTRSATRRRDNSESFPFMKDELAPSGSSGPVFRDEHSEDDADREITESNVSGITSPFSLSRVAVTHAPGLDSSKDVSNWNMASAASPKSVLGAFGSLGLGGQSTVSSTPKRPDLGPFRESRFRGLMNPSKTVEAQTEEVSGKQPVGGFANTGEGDVQRERSRNDDNTLERQDSGQQGSWTVGDSPYTGHSYRQSTAPSSTKRRFDEELGSEEQNKDAGSGPSRGDGEYRYQELNQLASYPVYGQHGLPQEEPLSPTYTNPYSSPQQQSVGVRESELDERSTANLHLPGLGEYHRQDLSETSSAFASRRELNRAPSNDLRQAERNQYHSTNINRGFQPLGGFGGLGSFGGSDSWPSGLSSGTPIREKGPFGELPGQALSGPDHGPIGHSSKLSSLIPTSIQEQMRGEQGRAQREDRNLQPVSEHLENFPKGSTSRREAESPYRTIPAKFDDFVRNAEVGSSFHGGDTNPIGEVSNNLASQTLPQHSQFNQSQPPYLTQAPGQRSGSVPGMGVSSQPPAAQQKTMVMPDRIRWIYRDPQGNTQGPWSGLEMHDWYRAGFFSPELLVKKVEDVDYEPLAQLIRRIGNSREPFLVPQIGIPGPPSSQSNANWPNQPVISSPSAATAGAQPPFAGSFPSFGTTLTAEQQNALERRKQEEQYLMARQKEHLAQQQLARQLQSQHGAHAQQLQHHSSTQSLQSQPSFGSMTSPGGFQTSPPQGMNPMNTGMAGAFESPFRGAGGVGMSSVSSGVENLGHIREEQSPALFSRFGLEQNPQVSADDHPSAGRSRFADLSSFDEPSALAISDRAHLETQQAEFDRLHQFHDQGEDLTVNERLREFQELRNNIDSENYGESLNNGREQADTRSLIENEGKIALPSTSLQEGDDQTFRFKQEEIHTRNTAKSVAKRSHSLSLTEQVQQAASSKQSSVAPPRTKADTVAPESTPPQSSSPLPAPAARRGRPNVADAFAAEPLSQSQSPAEETPNSSIAPWAKESYETQKQPSLREIQESEAKKAARQEEALMANRRAAMERDMANQVPTAAPGLPSSSTWGSSESPLSHAAPGASAWIKPVVNKTAVPASAPPKKTLQQIQAEEEVASRKKKASAANNATIASHVAGAAQAMSSGKRYADLAGKTSSPSPPSAGAWTTVGAGGKAKVPPTATAATLTAVRSTVPTSGASSADIAKSNPQTINSKTSLAVAKQNAQEELKKWAIAELRPDLNKDIQVEEFVQTLLNFPTDTDMITEVVHQNSSTIDSRHFAEEFVRRRGLAEKGKTDATGTGGSYYNLQAAGNKSSGWNEVARKGSSANATRDESNGAFKIVAAKKKGKK